MRNFSSCLFAFLLSLAPVFQTLGQGELACGVQPSAIAVLQSLQSDTAPGDVLCCSDKDASKTSLSPACSTGHQCCATDAPLTQKPLAVVGSRSLLDADSKAIAEHSIAHFSAPRISNRQAAPPATRLPGANAPSCSLIQRWRI